MTSHQSDRIALLIQQGTRLIGQGQAAEAVSLLEEALRIDQANDDAALNLGAGYILTRRFRRAVRVLEQLAQRAPDNPMVWTNLGAAYLGNPVLATDDDQRRAIEAFKRALLLDHHAPNVAYNIGLIHKDRRERAEAITWFQRALESNPQDRDARYWINQLHHPPAGEGPA